jgi:ABC-type multidrug transport system ATPase subunit
VIRVVNVTQHYGIKPVLKDVSLEIPSGTRTAVIGPNGTGKTTLLSVIGGVLAPQYGYVEIDGMRRRSSIENELEIRKRAVFLPDRSFLPKNRTGREFLLGVGRVYEVEEERLLLHSQRLLELFDLSPLSEAPIRTYSAGQQKKIALSAALITDADILLLDEPFSGGLDPSGILAMRHVIQRLAQEQGRTIVLTSPVPELVAEVADRLVVIRNGVVAANGSIEEIRRQTGHQGSIESMLHQVIFPEASGKLDAYFRGEKS